MIWEELDKAIIFDEVDATDWKDVMMKVGGTLVQENYAKKSYIDALITRETEFPTGLDVNGIGVAIPHTDVTHVQKPGIAIAVLKNPVDFIQMGSDDDIVKVQLIFMLAVVDPSAHLEKLQRILAIIQDTYVLMKLLNVHEKQEIIEIIKKKEKEL